MGYFFGYWGPGGGCDGCGGGAEDEAWWCGGGAGETEFDEVV